MGFFNKFKKKKEEVPAGEDEYIELDSEQNKDEDKQIIVKTFSLTDFTDIKPVLSALRDGYTISIINIAELKEKDLTELKRAINKLKKTCDAVNGEIAGFGDDCIIVTPSIAKIQKSEEEVEDL